MKTPNPYARATAEFDLMNAQDPNSINVNGKKVPFELFFAKKMSEWVFRLDPNASEALRLAARCQHLCRWEIPRSSYPEGRVGYLRWRKDLKTFHADKSAEVLRNMGYDQGIVDRVRSINLKKGLGKDFEIQVIEDALCLVFLEHQYDDLIAKTSEDKMIYILQKTWAKMSEKAHEFALELQYSEIGQRLIEKALAS